jgi:hypothetical protein
VDPTSGLQYEVVQVKMNRKRYIIVYRIRVSHGKLSGALDGPIHAEEVVFWKKSCIKLSRQQKNKFSKRMWPYGRKKNTHTQVKSPLSDPCAFYQT